MKIDLLAIVGQTGTGKTSLSLELAKSLGGEIIAADSQTVYKGLDIGTAKPTQSERKTAPHHLLDVTTPDKGFSVALYQKLARKAIADISQRNKLPILVGGSGLYVDSLLKDYQFGNNPAQPDLRSKLSKMTISQLQAEIKLQGKVLPQNKKNKRYLIRVLERKKTKPKPIEPRLNTLIIGLYLERHLLEERLRQRLEEMWLKGVVDEAQWLVKNYSTNSLATKGNIYQSLKPYFEKKISQKQAKEDFIKKDLKLAKKQLTWFKRNSQIVWFFDANKAYQYCLETLKHT